MKMHVSEDVQNGFAFVIPDLFKPSSLAHFDDVTPVIEDLQPLSPLKEPQLELAVHGDLESGLFNVLTFEYGPIEDIGALGGSSVGSLESLDAPEVVEENLWTSLQLDKKDLLSTNLESWEVFFGERSKQRPTNSFLSEGGSQVYDAALIESIKKSSPHSLASESGHVIRAQPYLSSLILLALGRESIVYRYNAEENLFRPRKSNTRMSGYSLQTFDSISDRLQKYGNCFRALQDLISEIQRSSKAPQAYFALAGAFMPILGSLESQIACPPTPVRSLLQLQVLVEEPGQILECLSKVVSEIQGTRSDEELLSRLFELVRTAEYSPVGVLPVLQGLLVSASRPWLDSVERWLGLQPRSHFGRRANFPAFALAGKTGTNADVEYSNSTDDYELHASLVPSFISTEDAETIFETGKSLRLLEVHQPNHPYTKQFSLVEGKLLKLEWQFTWDDIEIMSAKATAYEFTLRNALDHVSSELPTVDQVLPPGMYLNSTKHTTPDESPQSAKSFINNFTAQFEEDPPNIGTAQTPFTGVNNLDKSSTFAPPASLLSTLSFNPIISACARLINRASLRLLLQTQHLRSHLSLLHRYVLMSDGVFTSRLSQALFSPNLSTTEWRPGHTRSGHVGLKLGHRDTWPPASSELRLALTGILTDSYFNSTQFSKCPVKSTNLPGDLSFAVRPMSSDELKKCSDPNSLSALDFLRLTYTPAAPLDSIITLTSLEKYDSVFKLLLRCNRMLFVVSQLGWSARRSSAYHGSQRRKRYQHHVKFRNESRHFVSTVCSHFFNNVASYWQHLDHRLETLESAMTSDSDFNSPKGAQDVELETESIGSIHVLRTFHEDLLDQLMLALLLRKRQEQVMSLLEEIWGLVLRFAWMVNSGDDNGDDHNRGGTKSGGVTEDTTADERDAEIGQLYGQFRRKVRVFVEVCRGLSDKSHGDHEMAGMGMGMEHLVVMFDMNGFYA